MATIALLVSFIDSTTYQCPYDGHHKAGRDEVVKFGVEVVFMEPKHLSALPKIKALESLVGKVAGSMISALIPKLSPRMDCFVFTGPVTFKVKKILAQEFENLTPATNRPPIAQKLASAVVLVLKTYDVDTPTIKELTPILEKEALVALNNNSCHCGNSNCLGRHP